MLIIRCLLCREKNAETYSPFDKALCDSCTCYVDDHQKQGLSDNEIIRKYRKEHPAKPEDRLVINGSLNDIIQAAVTAMEDQAKELSDIIEGAESNYKYYLPEAYHNLKKLVGTVKEQLN